MRTALRDVQACKLVTIERLGVPQTKRGRVSPKVDEDVPNRPSHAGHELALSSGRHLVMESAQRPALRVCRQAGLHECHPGSEPLELLPIPNARERAALIHAWRGPQEVGAVYLQRG